MPTSTTRRRRTPPPNFQLQYDRTDIPKLSAECAAKKTPREAVESLTRLNGVGLKIASAILMSMFPELYTVCDFRASEALGVKDCNDVDFYIVYLDACLRMAKECGVSLRDFDRANWQWSKSKTKVKRSMPNIALGRRSAREARLPPALAVLRRICAAFP
jgi:hypothetical protein